MEATQRAAAAAAAAAAPGAVRPRARHRARAQRARWVARASSGSSRRCPHSRVPTVAALCGRATRAAPHGATSKVATARAAWWSWTMCSCRRAARTRSGHCCGQTAHSASSSRRSSSSATNLLHQANYTYHHHHHRHPHHHSALRTQRCPPRGGALQGALMQQCLWAMTGRLGWSARPW